MVRLKRIFLWLNILFLGGCTAIFGACTSTWDEEVILSDGRVILVERKIIRERGGDELSLNASGAKTKIYTIGFNDPDGLHKIIKWQSMKYTAALWPDYPLVLDKEQGDFVVYSSLGAGSVCKYKYIDGRWVEELLPSRVPEMDSNLLISDYQDRPGMVTLKIKMQRNADARYWQDAKIGPDINKCDAFSK